MIQKKTVTLWTASDGSEHKTLDSLKTREIEGVIRDVLTDTHIDILQAALRIVEASTKVIDILSLRESSLPSARKANGAPPKKRKSKRVEALQTTIPGTGLPPEILDRGPSTLNEGHQPVGTK